METKQTNNNPCYFCNEEIKEGKEKLVSCEDLGFIHGKECNCGISVGVGCFNKHKLKEIKDAEKMKLGMELQ